MRDYNLDNHNLNNYMLTNEYISVFLQSYTPFVIKPSLHKITKQTKTINAKNDALFWCVYNIIYPNNIINIAEHHLNADK